MTVFHGTPYKTSSENPTRQHAARAKSMTLEEVSSRAAGMSRMRQKQHVDDMEQSEVRVYASGQRKLTSARKYEKPGRPQHHVTYVLVARGWKRNQRRKDASRRITNSEDALPVPAAWARA